MHVRNSIYFLITTLMLAVTGCRSLKPIDLPDETAADRGVKVRLLQDDTFTIGEYCLGR